METKRIYKITEARNCWDKLFPLEEKIIFLRETKDLIIQENEEIKSGIKLCIDQYKKKDPTFDDGLYQFEKDRLRGNLEKLEHVLSTLRIAYIIEHVKERYLEKYKKISVKNFEKAIISMCIISSFCEKNGRYPQRQCEIQHSGSRGWYYKNLKRIKVGAMTDAEVDFFHQCNFKFEIEPLKQEEWFGMLVIDLKSGAHKSIEEIRKDWKNGTYRLDEWVKRIKKRWYDVHPKWREVLFELDPAYFPYGAVRWDLSPQAKDVILESSAGDDMENANPLWHLKPIDPKFYVHRWIDSPPYAHISEIREAIKDNQSISDYSEISWSSELYSVIGENW